MTASKLSTLFRLSHKVTIYVPSRKLNGQSIPEREDIITATAKLLSRLFGGATATDAVGFWTLATGEVQREHVKLVFAYAEQVDDEAINAIWEHARHIKAIGQQEAVAVEIDGDLYFV